jgi:23S rRNA pseudouridine2605 synthase
MTTTLQKFLQFSGFDSRRNIRKMIADGKLKINGKVVTDPNAPVDVNRDSIRCEDRRLHIKMEKKVYFIFNKPAGVISTLSDPQNRITISHFLRKIRERVYPVGRLDYHSEGLILLTNDGDLTNFIISAKNQVPKTYLIKVKGILNQTKIDKMTSRGVFIERQKIRPLEIKFVRKTGRGNAWYTVSIIEGKKHVIRKLFQFSGHPVERLRRISLGNLKLKKLPGGHWRELTHEEIEAFKRDINYPPV